MKLCVAERCRPHPLRGVAAVTLFALCASSAAANAQIASAPAAAAVQPLISASVSAAAVRDSLVALAKAQLGRPYVWGGNSPSSGFDCSGLVRYVMEAFKLDVPRTAEQQAAAGLPVPRDVATLRPGDLLTFGKPKSGVSHVGIYVGNGRFIHASSVAGRVVESRLKRPASPLIKPWQGVRRFLALDDSAATEAPKGGG